MHPNSLKISLPPITSYNICLALVLALLSIWPSSCAFAHSSLGSLGPSLVNGAVSRQSPVADDVQSDPREPGLRSDRVHQDFGAYQAQFLGVDRSIVGRADTADVQVIGIVGNTPKNLNVQSSTSVWFSFEPTPTPAPQQRRSLADLLPPRDVNDAGKLKAVNGQEEVQKDLPNYRRPEDEEHLSRRQKSTPTIYISVNTCLQPTFDSDDDNENPPQLTLHVQPQDPRYDTRSNPPSSITTQLSEGYANVTVDTSDPVFIGISAPDARKKGGSQDWNFDVAASTDGMYHSLIEQTNFNLYLIDSDPNAALLVTNGLEDWAHAQGMQGDVHAELEKGPPLDIFVRNINYTGIRGLSNSYCAVQKDPQVLGNQGDSYTTGFEMGITHNQPGGLSEEQFYIPGLNKSSTYLGVASTMNHTAEAYGEPIVGGGGTLYPTMNFTTKRDANCQVIYNLTFCSQVAFSVPANPDRFNATGLRTLYDDQARDLFKNFTYSLAQIPCNTTETAQYSLAAGCDNCTDAYKTWLCTVTIPKCEDFNLPFGGMIAGANGSNSSFGGDDFQHNNPAESSGDDPSLENPVVPGTSYLMPRNVAQRPLNASLVQPPNVKNTTLLSWLATNSSRMNDTIAGKIQPGPYMEVLPCEDLCYDLVRMCPAKLQFSCPEPGSLLMRASYGRRGLAKGGGHTCSSPGALYFKSEGSTHGFRFGYGLGTLSIGISVLHIILALLWPG